MNTEPVRDTTATVIHQADLTVARLPGIEHRTLASQAHGLSHLSVWEQSLAPGAATPPHRHDTEEVVLCRSGWGELQMQGQVHRFGPQTRVVIPPNLPHQIFNVGDEPLEMTAIFATAAVEVFDNDDQPMPLPW